MSILFLVWPSSTSSSSEQIIKFQAWEEEFQARMEAARSKELRVYRKSIYLNTVSGMVYTALPLAVAISTFSLYVSLGHELDVATALTSLALFEILRFPLFILPMVINNIVEARVSVDRVQSFLTETDKVPVPCDPLTNPGIYFSNATLVYESIKQKLIKPTSELSVTEKCTMIRDVSSPEVIQAEQSSVVLVLVKGWSLVWSGVKYAATFCWTCFCGKSPLSAPAKAASNMSDIEFELLVRRAQVEAAEKRLVEFEKEHHMHQMGDLSENEQSDLNRRQSSRGGRRKKALHNVLEEEGSEGEGEKGLAVTSPLHNGEGKGGEVELATRAAGGGEEGGQRGVGERVLTLFRVSMQAQRGSLLCIVGRVGSGKVWTGPYIVLESPL